MVTSYLDGVLQIANVFLAIIAGIIAVSLFNISHKQKHLKPWRSLIICLILFAIEEIFGALYAFNIYAHPFITHLIPSIILIVLMYVLFSQIEVSEKWRI